MFDKSGTTFSMYSTTHLIVLILLFISIRMIFILKDRKLFQEEKRRYLEVLFAISLLSVELLYHVWAITTENWHVDVSLSIELCSFSLFAVILLLWTGNKHLMDFVFFAGIGGALQAFATPVLEYDFPHFRFFHFFYTHFGIMLTAFYFIGIKGYRPTFKALMKTMCILNFIAGIVFFINKWTDGNYMFLRFKPEEGTLLDYLGPYPWYLISLELAAFLVFILLWLIFRKRGPNSAKH